METPFCIDACCESCKEIITKECEIREKERVQELYHFINSIRPLNILEEMLIGRIKNQIYEIFDIKE